MVGRSGRITTADAARELGISHGLASHHLHQLVKYGFVEQVGGADNRERPWQLVATSHSHEGIEGKPGGAAAVAVLNGQCSDLSRLAGSAVAGILAAAVPGSGPPAEPDGRPGTRDRAAVTGS